MITCDEKKMFSSSRLKEDLLRLEVIRRIIDLWGMSLNNEKYEL